MSASPRPSRWRAIVLFRLGPVEIAVHPSWLAMFVVLTLIARQALVKDVTDPNGAWGALLSMAIALLFFCFILLHELSHTIVARAHGLDARRITLFLFGGVSQLGSEARSPGDEYRIAIAGPLASLIIAGALAAVARSLHPDATWLEGLWGQFAVVNGVLALFNLVPAFPLDGGRVLRAALWAALRDRAKATRWASNSGKAFAFSLMAIGSAIVFLTLVDGHLEGLWGLQYLALGYFLFNVAGAAGRLEGGAVPRSPGEPVRPEEGPAIVGTHEGEAAESDARSRGVRLDERADASATARDQPRDRPRHPRRRPPDA